MKKLEEHISYLQERIQDYEKAERMLIEKVNQINRNSQQYKQQTNLLIEERSDFFARIEKQKQDMIDKLNAVIQEQALEIQAQTYENIKLKNSSQSLRQSYEQLEKHTQEELQNLRIVIENK